MLIHTHLPTATTHKSARARGYVRLKGALLIGATMAVALLSGCHKAPPSGQVVARVNGEEITARDIRTELAASKLGAEADIKALTPLVVRRIIDRKLVAAAGKAAALDKTPDFVAQVSRADEALLGNEMLRKWADGQPDPIPAEIARFIAANPNMFGRRAQVQLVQLRTGPTGLGMDVLGPLKSIAEVVALLRERNITFQVSRTVVDTAELTKQADAQIRAAAGGEPLVNRQGDHLMIAAVVQLQPVAMSEEERRLFAVQRIKQAGIVKQVDALRKSAQIEYQKGYAPPASAPR